MTKCRQEARHAELWIGCPFCGYNVADAEEERRKKISRILLNSREQDIRRVIECIRTGEEVPKELVEKLTEQARIAMMTTEEINDETTELARELVRLRKTRRKPR